MIYFNIEIENFTLKEKLKIKKLIKSIIEDRGYKTGEINYIFMDDESLMAINIEYLDHHTYTDIITFDNSEEDKLIEADIFISVDRVKENAIEFNTDFEDELIRVMSHGIFHLLGYQDETEEDIKLMRKAEDEAIELYYTL